MHSANRIEKGWILFIFNIIHPNQTGFLHGWYIGDNVRQVLETIEHYEKSGKPGPVFMADFEKVLDKVRL